jgi:hypothetical protein
VQMSYNGREGACIDEGKGGEWEGVWVGESAGVGG